MEVDSIENLRSARDLLKASVKAIKVREFEGRTFGSESEYDARGVVAGVDSIITDIGGLLRAPKRFLQCSNHPERVALNKQLSNLNHYLTDEDLASACNHVEALKPILRGYAIRYTDERFDEFIERTNELQKQIQSLTELLSESKEAHKEILEITSTAQSLKNEIESQNKTLTERQTTLEELIVESEETRNTIIENFETDKANSSEIEALLTEVRSHSELIDSFSQKIAARENQIENQSSKSKEFESTLVNYTSQQIDYITEAKNLIKTA
jgi:myosin heavy subunit